MKPSQQVIWAKTEEPCLFRQAAYRKECQTLSTAQEIWSRARKSISVFWATLHLLNTRTIFQGQTWIKCVETEFKIVSSSLQTGQCRGVRPAPKLLLHSLHAEEAPVVLSDQRMKVHDVTRLTRIVLLSCFLCSLLWNNEENNADFKSALF